MEMKFIEQYAFEPGNKGEFSDSITKTWTEQALECYSIGCNCQKCSLAGGNYSFVCQMPKVIDLLIKVAGKPSVKPVKMAN